MLNAADTIVTYADRPEVVRESGNLMLRGLTHLRDVARAILDQNRLDRTGQPLRAVDFEDLRLLFEPEAASRDQRLDWQITTGDATLAALPSAQVRQVTLNLLLNASEAAGTGGRVGLSVTNGADVLSIVVDDTGPGLGPDHLARLMSSGPLPPGGGVGLRLAHDIVVGLNGQISHTRTDGATVIRVDLPAQVQV